MRAHEFITEADDYNEYARELAAKYNVPYSMVQHAMNKETGHLKDPAAKARAVSRAGAQGVMQLMPKTAKGLGVTDSFNAKQNIQGGVKYLSQMLNKFQDPKIALAAYNYGPGNVNKWLAKGGDPSKLPRETRRYVYGDPKKNIPGYTTDEEMAQQAAAAKPIGLPPKVATVATDTLAAVTGSKNAYGQSEIPQRPITPVVTPKVTPVQPIKPVTAPVPTITPPSATTLPTGDFTISRGDTLSGIAKSKGMSVQDIMALNPEITDPNKIAAGAKLRTSSEY